MHGFSQSDVCLDCFPIFLWFSFANRFNDLFSRLLIKRETFSIVETPHVLSTQSTALSTVLVPDHAL